MNGPEGNKLREISQTLKDKYHFFFIYMWNLKKQQQNKQINRLMGGDWGMGVKGERIKVSKLSVIKAVMGM